MSVVSPCWLFVPRKSFDAFDLAAALKKSSIARKKNKLSLDFEKIQLKN